MKNPKTTLAGYAILVATVLTVVAHLLTGGGLSAADLAAIPAALTGIGFIAATDGGH